MSKHIFECIDAHTCGNPIRLIKSGGPKLEGKQCLISVSISWQNIIGFFEV